MKCFRDKCENETKNNNKFCSFSCNTRYQNSIRISNLIEYNKNKSEKFKIEYYENPKTCLCCDNIISYENRLNKFCNQSCAAKFNNKNRTAESRERQRISLISYINSPDYIYIKPKKLKNPKEPKVVEQKFRYEGKFIEISPNNCEWCNKIFIVQTKKVKRFCCISCKNKFAGRSGGIKSASMRIKRSKNEIYFADLCSKKFKILTNEPMFNGWDADIILPELKIAVLWNGPWHRKKINQKSFS